MSAVLYGGLERAPFLCRIRNRRTGRGSGAGRRGVEHRAHSGGEAGEQRRRCAAAARVHAMHDVAAAPQREYPERLVARVDSPREATFPIR